MYFNDISEAAFRRDSVGNDAELYDIQAYWCMWYLYRAQKRGEITIEQAKADKVRVSVQHKNAERQHKAVVAEWKRQQDGIQRAGALIQELTKVASPDADKAVLLNLALDIIGEMRGEVMTSEAIKKKLC